MMITNHLIAMTTAYVLDRLVGDPSWLPHPVRMMGALISKLEHRLNQGTYRKAKGILFLVIVVGVVFVLTLFITMAAYALHMVVGIVTEALFIATTIASRGLATAASDVYEPLVDRDLRKARKQLSFIVGRDTNRLSAADITRATVETVAENTSDGVTAPLFWALIGGAPLALVYRAVNTCDSMVGYKSARFRDFGWAAAKTDDLLNYVPSRLTAILMILANRAHEAQTKWSCFRLLFRDANNHPSPNSGWGEAATAALLGVQVGGESTYQGIVSERAVIGKALVPLTSHHILQAVYIMERTVFASLLFYWLGGSLIVFTATWF